MRPSPLRDAWLPTVAFLAELGATPRAIAACLDLRLAQVYHLLAYVRGGGRRPYPRYRERVAPAFDPVDTDEL